VLWIPDRHPGPADPDPVPDPYAFQPNAKLD
jgi:hypothetical protein